MEDGMARFCYFIQKFGVDSPMALITKKSLDGPNRWLKIQIIDMCTGHISTGKATKDQILKQTEMVTPATAEDFFYTICNHIDKGVQHRKKAMAKILGLKKLS